MITELHIAGLRGVESGSLVGLGPLTVLVGPNGGGKSTVLDALLIGAGSSPGDAIGRAVQRRPKTWNASRWLFNREADDPTATLRVVRGHGAQDIRTTTLAWTEGPTDSNAVLSLEQRQEVRPFTEVSGEVLSDGASRKFRVTFSAGNGFRADPASAEARIRGWELRLIDIPRGVYQPIEDVYSEAVKSGRWDAARLLLQEVLGASFVDLVILTDNQRPVVHLKGALGTVPATLAGDGVFALIRLAAELAARPRGVVLLEEPEVHLHPRLLWQTARLIWASVIRGVQVVLSTHSIELIDALVAHAPEDGLNDLTVWRVALQDRQLRCSPVSGAEVRVTRVDLQDDLR